MKRTVIAPVALPASAVAELKQWLGINATREDALLTGLLNSALEMCESYTGRRPIEALCEEVWSAQAQSHDGWQTLSSRPVQSISAVEALTSANTRIALGANQYAIELDADGTGRFRIIDRGGERRFAIRFIAGIADRWDALPEGLRHGVLRLAVHHYRGRDAGEQVRPPSAVAALWQPWRRMRLA